MSSVSMESISLSHIAIACPEIQKVARRLRALALEIAETHEVPSEKVTAALIAVKVSDSFRIELLEPTTPDSPVSRFLAKRSEGGLHHVAFEVEHLERWEKRLKEEGLEILPPGIRKAARGRALFIHPRSIGGVLVELEELGREG
jgi:methylmalonyl-CoA/ethylmalonyl-CoA epimerase